MKTITTARAQLVIGLATLALAGPPAALAAGVVGAGSAASCTDALLNTALTGGGLVTFNCGGGLVTIDISPGAGGSGTKTISTDTTIDGGGLITISGGNSVEVFFVNTGVKFTVQNLTISDGFSGGGGAIFNNGGTVTITKCTLSNNVSSNLGGAIFINFGSVAITSSTFSGNRASATGVNPQLGGGAILNGGTLTVTASTFIDNSASGSTSNGFGNAMGGAILNGNPGTATLTNCTFTGNMASLSGGGTSQGGAIFTIQNPSVGGTATTTVTNCTISGNSAGQGGSLFNFRGGVTVQNTIVADSLTGGNCAGDSVIDSGHNIDDGTTCGFTGTNCSTTSGTSFCNTNPDLDPAGLQNNGGPTRTIALQANSPALDAANNIVCATAPVSGVDQRGLPRFPLGDPNCDIGAFELQPPNRAPALSHAGLLGLIALLGTVGLLALRRPARQ